MPKLKKGTLINGFKVIGFCCKCKHDFGEHLKETREINGEQYRDGDKWITPIIKKPIIGKCSVDKCKCKEYKETAIKLENGKIEHTNQVFLCDECKEYKTLKYRAPYYGMPKCVKCFDVFRDREIEKKHEEIKEIEKLKQSIEDTRVFRQTVEFERDDDDREYCSMDISIEMVFDALIRSKNKSIKYLRYVK